MKSKSNEGIMIMMGKPKDQLKSVGAITIDDLNDLDHTPSGISVIHNFMAMDRAKEINSHMNSLFFYSEGIARDTADHAAMLDALAFLRPLSLRDMLAAADAISNAPEVRNDKGNVVLTTICDDRLIAAIYAFLNYPCNGGGKMIINDGRFGLFTMKTK